MTDLYRIESVWSGLTGMPGYTTFYSLSTPDPTDVRAFFLAVAAYIPSPCTIQVAGSGDIIDDDEGELQGTWTGATPGVVGCTGGAYGAPAGGIVSWTTSTVRRGRILRGRTFLVPMSSSNYTTSGQITSGTVSTIQTAAAALVSAFAGQLVVWGRPVWDYSTTPPTKLASGTNGIVTGAVAQSKVATLRTRRD